MRLIITIGISGSGKSYWAREFISKNPEFVEVNRDNIRIALYGNTEKMWQGDENLVTKIQYQQIEEAFKSGKSVISSDTNLNPRAVENLRKVAEKYNAEVEINDSFLEVPIETCIERDANRYPRVGKDIIIKQTQKAGLFKMKNIYDIKFTPQDKNKPKAITCDLDGTLCLFDKINKDASNYRNPYDASTCENDLPNEAVVSILKQFHNAGYSIILVSGREDKYRPQTLRWLSKHLIPYKYLYMRQTKDSRKDAEIKLEIYRDSIIPEFYVEFVLDDRNQVVTALRDAGLTVLQVAEGNF